jgi:heptosyltransferase-2
VKRYPHDIVNPGHGKILVIRGGAIGDFILTLPVLAALRQQFPAAHIEVLGYPHIVSLAVAGGLAHRAQPIEARALAGFFARDGGLDPGLADYFSEFDLILSYLYDPDEIFQTNVGRCSDAQFIAGPHRPKEDAGIPAAKVFLKPLERLAIFDADCIPRLSIAVAGPDQNRLALHPGSGSERKNWPEAKWAELLQDLVNLTDLDLLLVGGEAEGERLQRLAAALPPTRARVAQSLPLPKLAVSLRSCCAFIGHDSGISHLAAALGLSGLLLWSDTVEAVWRPPGDKMVLLRHPRGLDHLEAAQVMLHLKRVVEASTRL